MSDEGEFWSDGGIPLDDLTVWITQFCNACGHRSKPVRTYNELTDAGWVLQTNLNLCPVCRKILLNLIRQQ